MWFSPLLFLPEVMVFEYPGFQTYRFETRRHFFRLVTFLRKININSRNFYREQANTAIFAKVY
jgi:hypothetical protein